MQLDYGAWFQEFDNMTYWCMLLLLATAELLYQCNAMLLKGRGCEYLSKD